MVDSVKYDTVVEEYIEIIWKLLRNNPVTRIKDIASIRGVTLPTASSAVDKLKELGLVEHESYGYVALSSEGERLARYLEETHRAIKELLVKILNIPEDIAEDDACKLEHHISEQTITSMKNFIKVMKALSDPTRIKIVKMLQHKTMCVCEMREALQIAQPSVSKHLKILWVVSSATLLNTEEKSPGPTRTGLKKPRRPRQWRYHGTVDRLPPE